MNESRACLSISKITKEHEKETYPQFSGFSPPKAILLVQSTSASSGKYTQMAKLVKGKSIGIEDALHEVKNGALLDTS